MSRVLVVVTALSLVMLSAGTALADNVANEIDTPSSILAITRGDTTGASDNWKINASGGDGQAGCNASDGSDATMSFIGLPAGVTADPVQPVFTDCGNDGEKSVNFTAALAAVAGDYAITVSIADSGLGTYNPAGGAFTLRVLNPAPAGDTTAPTNASIDINDGATWTNTTAVTLDIAANDNVGITKYRLAESQTDLGSAADVAVTPSTSFSASDVPFAVTGTDNAGKAVWVRFFDAAGNSADASDTIGLDRVAPTVTCIAASFLLNEPNATVSASVTDELSGPAASPISGAADTTSVGGKTVSLTGYDNAGNSTPATCSYTVAYNFVGFDRPVDNDNILNILKAGQAVPLKFRLTDANNQPVLSGVSASVSVASLSCSAGTSADLLEEVASGSSGLQNLGDGYYQFNWKTPTSYANSCKTMRLNLGEGSSSDPIYHTALFQFKK